jgi:hypothetical protein
MGIRVLGSIPETQWGENLHLTIKRKPEGVYATKSAFLRYYTPEKE